MKKYRIKLSMSPVTGGFEMSFMNTQIPYIKFGEATLLYSRLSEAASGQF